MPITIMTKVKVRACVSPLYSQSIQVDCKLEAKVLAFTQDGHIYIYIYIFATIPISIIIFILYQFRSHVLNRRCLCALLTSFVRA